MEHGTLNVWEKNLLPVKKEPVRGHRGKVCGRPGKGCLLAGAIRCNLVFVALFGVDLFLVISVGHTDSLHGIGDNRA